MMLRKFLFPVLGGAFVVAGLDKVLGSKSYETAFDRLGWSEAGMRAVGVAEMAGGALMLCACTRRTGAVIAGAASAAVLASELDEREQGMARARAGMLGGAILAFLAPARR